MFVVLYNCNNQVERLKTQLKHSGFFLGIIDLHKQLVLHLSRRTFHSSQNMSLGFVGLHEHMFSIFFANNTCFICLRHCVLRVPAFASCLLVEKYVDRWRIVIYVYGCFSQQCTSQTSRTLQSSAVYFSRVSYLLECNANDTYVLRIVHIRDVTGSNSYVRVSSNSRRQGSPGRNCQLKCR